MAGKFSRKFGLLMEKSVPMCFVAGAFFFGNHNGQIKVHKMIVHNFE